MIGGITAFVTKSAISFAFGSMLQGGIKTAKSLHETVLVENPFTKEKFRIPKNEVMKAGSLYFQILKPKELCPCNFSALENYANKQQEKKLLWKQKIIMAEKQNESKESKNQQQKHIDEIAEVKKEKNNEINNLNKNEEENIETTIQTDKDVKETVKTDQTEEKKTDEETLADTKDDSNSYKSQESVMSFDREENINIIDTFNSNCQNKVKTPEQPKNDKKKIDDSNTNKGFFSRIFSGKNKNNKEKEEEKKEKTEEIKADKELSRSEKKEATKQRKQFLKLLKDSDSNENSTPMLLYKYYPRTQDEPINSPNKSSALNTENQKKLLSPSKENRFVISTGSCSVPTFNDYKNNNSTQEKIPLEVLFEIIAKSPFEDISIIYFFGNKIMQFFADENRVTYEKVLKETAEKQIVTWYRNVVKLLLQNDPSRYQCQTPLSDPSILILLQKRALFIEQSFFTH